ncbi:MAG: protein kinase [Rickettsiales bacterium]|jgi:serine/threonine protein kinase|nr:protein kinase [Rickettsiales bacterium]
MDAMEEERNKQINDLKATGLFSNVTEEDEKIMVDGQRIKKLGVGGFGEVFKVYSEKENRYLAVKILTKPIEANRGEHLYLSKSKEKPFNSPSLMNISHISDNGTVIVSEFCDGSGLDKLSNPPKKNKNAETDRTKAQKACQDPDRLKEMFIAVKELHDRGLAHRDIKGQNVILGNDGKFTIIDHGLLQNDSQNITEIIGTRGYIPPELSKEALGNVKVDFKKHDVFSMGIMLFQVLALDKGKTMVDLCGVPNDWALTTMYENKPEEVEKRIEEKLEKSELSTEIKDIIRKSTSMDPAKRCTIDFMINRVEVMKERLEKEKESKDISPKEKETRVEKSEENKIEGEVKKEDIVVEQGKGDENKSETKRSNTLDSLKKTEPDHQNTPVTVSSIRIPSGGAGTGDKQNKPSGPFTIK